MEPEVLAEPATITSRFTGKTAIVTGGAGDLGRAVAGRLAAEGAAVLVVDVDESGLQDTADAIRGNGGTAQRFVADVTNPVSVERYVNEAARLGRGTVDAFFNNAGIPCQPVRADRGAQDVLPRLGHLPRYRGNPAVRCLHRHPPLDRAGAPCRRAARLRTDAHRPCLLPDGPGHHLLSNLPWAGRESLLCLSS